MKPKKLLAKCAIVTASAVAGAQSADAQTARDKDNAYFNSAYTFCDAKKIGVVWNQNAYGGKQVIGAKILSGLTHLADADIKSTSRTVACTFRELELTYEDAQRLASYWNMSVGQAKTHAEALGSKWGGKELRRRLSGVI